MAKTHQRALALTLAILFFGTSVATGAAVIWQIRDEKKQANSNTDLDQQEIQKLLQEQQQKNNNEQTNKTEGNMLQGTKLADFEPRDKIEQLEAIDVVPGTGEEVKPGATIKAHYTGAVAKDGTIFQSSRDLGQAIEFSLNGVIQGWTNGVPGMKVGGKRRLLIPAAQAYGSTPPQGSGIPVDADLIFDIELESITKQ